MVPLITSILDSDLYKFSMQQAVIKKFSKHKVKYRFFNRGVQKFPKGFDVMLKEQVQYMSKLKLTRQERRFLEKRCKFFDPAYLDFLSGYRYDPNELDIKLDEEGHLSITIKGYWYRTILWEVPLMALISQLYFTMVKHNIFESDVRESNNKAKALGLSEHEIPFADLGSRRRFSFEIHDEVVGHFNSHGDSFVGTSNVYLAMLHDVKPLGTQAHEWFSFHGALFGYKMANKMAMEHWVDVYDGELGIALTDTYTTDNFYKNFNTKFAKLYDGVRHDSDDPFVFLEKTIAHYEKLGIDPMSKTIIFSDSLNVSKTIDIAKACFGRIDYSFGIGTYFTNDVGVTPLNMVIKMFEVEIDDEWKSVIKLSDVPGKNTGQWEEIQLAKQLLNIK